MQDGQDGKEDNYTAKVTKIQKYENMGWTKHKWHFFMDDPVIMYIHCMFYKVEVAWLLTTYILF